MRIPLPCLHARTQSAPFTADLVPSTSDRCGPPRSTITCSCAVNTSCRAPHRTIGARCRPMRSNSCSSRTLTARGWAPFTARTPRAAGRVQGPTCSMACTMSVPRCRTLRRNDSGARRRAPSRYSETNSDIVCLDVGKCWVVVVRVVPARRGASTPDARREKRATAARRRVTSVKLSASARYAEVGVERVRSV